MCTRPGGLSSGTCAAVRPALATPLYELDGPAGCFTYTPFAAVAFAVVSFIPWSALPPLSVAVIVRRWWARWVVLHALGYRPPGAPGRRC